MLRKSIYFCLGITSLALGIVGAFLPLLPTTCFVILSAWAFSKSSNKLHQLICSHKIFGPLVLNWQKNKSIPGNVKIIAITSIAFSAFITCFVLQEKILLQLITLFALLLVSIYLIRLPSTYQQQLSQS